MEAQTNVHSYFLVAVSNSTNLDLCIKHSLAGFTSSLSGLWTFLDIKVNDRISLLYGARVFNLYRVAKKEAIRNAAKLPPWPAVTFKPSGRSYYFPFRLQLEPLRKFSEPMVRQEFAYVAENLLLRGGYRKTHFQGDQTTLQSVSQMGSIYDEVTEPLVLLSYETFTPKITWAQKLESSPEVFYFKEYILQSLLRQWLSDDANLQSLLTASGHSTLEAKDFEVLGEKALPEGHVDILVKDAVPTGVSRKLLIEVKTASGTPKDVHQLRSYMDEMGRECVGGILIAKDYSRITMAEAKKRGIECFAYSFAGIDKTRTYSFEELKSMLRLSRRS